MVGQQANKGYGQHDRPGIDGQCFAAVPTGLGMRTGQSPKRRDNRQLTAKERVRAFDVIDHPLGLLHHALGFWRNRASWPSKRIQRRDAELKP
jgi:hypothetical protein